LQERLPERVGAALLRQAGIAEDCAAGSLTREDRRRLVAALISLPLPVTESRGWNHAEVTAGGVPLEEVDFRTMRSKSRRSLFLAGEILDVDGRIGGFNFQWAWASGRIAGRAAVRSLASR
jgi:predicted flavoprotein YhiN